MENKNDTDEFMSLKIIGIVVVLGIVGYLAFSNTTPTNQPSQNTAAQIDTPSNSNSTPSAQGQNVQPVAQNQNLPITNSAPTTPAISDASGNLLPSVIAQIEPNIVEINCYSFDGSIESSGSGVSYLNPNHSIGNAVMTNYHVYTGAIVGGQSPSCFAVFPEAPDFSFNQYYGDYELTLSDWHYNPSTYEDAAIFTLGAPLASSVVLNPVPIIEDFYNDLGIPKNQSQCSASDVSVGDSLTIFGYPNSGNLLGISETVTEGIVSGIVPGPIYKTNAAIDHGNSGGVAILNKNGCALGIPTLGASGLTSGIGYVQSYGLIDTPIN